MTSPLDEKAIAAAHEAYAKTTGGLLDGKPMVNAIRAYLSAAPALAVSQPIGDGMEERFPHSGMTTAEAVELIDRNTIDGLRIRLETAEAHVKRLTEDIEALRDLAERLKLEAQGHASEAKTANSTIYEIYRILSGGKGEPGNWNGAEPARQYVAKAEAQVSALRAALRAVSDTSHRARDRKHYRFPISIMQKVDEALKDPK